MFLHNVTHATTLLSALINGAHALLTASLRDVLHQPYRSALIHEYEDIRSMAEQAGAIGFFISGSGSTLMTVYTDDKYIARMQASVQTLSCAWRVLPLLPDMDGACVI